MCNILQLSEDCKVDWNASKIGMWARQRSNIGHVIYFFNIEAVCQESVTKMWIWLHYCLHIAQHRWIIHPTAKRTKEILTVIYHDHFYISRNSIVTSFQIKCKTCHWIETSGKWCKWWVLSLDLFQIWQIIILLFDLRYYWVYQLNKDEIRGHVMIC